MNQPSTFNLALAERIGDRIAEGETLATITAEPGMPSLDEVKQWLRDNSEFAGTLDQAMQFRREHFLDEMREVETKLLRGEIDVAKAEETLERLKRLIEYSDMPVGIW